MDELVKDFLQESTENLDRLDQEFVHLESDPSNSELLGSIFRTIHTIKGSCGFLGFTKLEKLTHASESLLSQMRAGELVLNSEIADHLLEMVDTVRALRSEIRTTESEGSRDYLDLVDRLKKLLTTALPAASIAATPPPAEIAPTSISQDIANNLEKKPEFENQKTSPPDAPPPQQRAAARRKSPNPASSRRASAEPSSTRAAFVRKKSSARCRCRGLATPGASAKS
jgi:two-component system, chemotaxis family, sensor kinase CheA